MIDQNTCGELTLLIKLHRYETLLMYPYTEKLVYRNQNTVITYKLTALIINQKFRQQAFS